MNQLPLPYEDRITSYPEKFFEGVNDVCSSVIIRPEWLMITMAIETVKTFDPAIQNPYTQATGLIQFMPDTARDLGTTIEELKKLRNYEQLYYVKKYLTPYRGRMKSYEDVYLTVFYPAAVGKPDSYPLGLSDEMRRRIAKVNAAYDVNKDNVIQKYEIRSVISKYVPAAWKDRI